MIDMEMYKKRVATLYADERTRWRKQLQKSVPKNIKLDLRPNQILPFTQQEFGKWMWQTQIQLNAILCHYCSAPIDILSLQLDHKTPLRKGGGPELANKQCICARCNRTKGQFTHEKYLLIVEFMRGPGAHFRAELEGVLSMGNSNMNFPGGRNGKPKGGKKPQHTQETLYFSDDPGEF
jgi:5-methylcytosine-specific restriction endonuclease McrA